MLRADPGLSRGSSQMALRPLSTNPAPSNLLNPGEQPHQLQVVV